MVSLIASAFACVIQPALLPIYQMNLLIIDKKVLISAITMSQALSNTISLRQLVKFVDSLLDFFRLWKLDKILTILIGGCHIPDGLPFFP